MNRFLKFALTLAFAMTLAHNSFAQILTPQGRLTLSSTQAVMTSDVVNTSTIYYLPYVGASVPIISGGTFGNYQLPTTTPLSVSLTDASAGDIRDIFVTLNSGSPYICMGNSWYDGASRSGSGSSLNLTQVNGIWVNQYLIGCANGSGGVDIAAHAGTYLGTFYATAAGETSMELLPTPTSGGTNNVLGLWNAYNRVPVTALCRDSKSSWTTSSASPLAADNNSYNNQITWIDGLQESPLEAKYTVSFATNSGGYTGIIGIELYGTGSATGTYGAQAVALPTAPLALLNSYPVFGLNHVVALEASPNGNVQTFENPNGYQSQALTLSITM